MSEPTRARIGDSVAVETTTTDYYIGQPNVTRTRVTLGRVVSVTRDGTIKHAEHFNGGAMIGTHYPLGDYRSYIIPASVVHPSDVARQAELHQWPGGQPYMPFESIAEARETLRPYLIKQNA